MIIKRSTTNEWSDQMRRFPITLAALLTSVCILNVATPAGASTQPVCLTGGTSDATLCDYANLAQCRATAAGGLGSCVTNPEYVAKAYASYRGAAKRIH
jgi:2-keto-3-deoxy-6-phosphogluconate aldolase